MMSAPTVSPEVLHTPVASLTSGSLSTQILTGRREILAMKRVLIEMSLRYGQQGAMDHLKYFLGTEDALKKIPHLVLVGAGRQPGGTLVHEPIAALLIYEYRVLGCGTKVFCTDDTTGRRSLIAPPNARMKIAKTAANALMRSGALVVLQTFQELHSGEDQELHSGEDQELHSGEDQELHSAEDQELHSAEDQEMCSGEDERGRPPPMSRSSTLAKTRRRFATVLREIPSYLPLESTMDATLAKIGQRTRSNMRYYRRRAESQLGCTFIENVRISRFAFKAFNRQCTYAVKNEEAGLRYDAISEVPGMFLCGILDREGRWLSMIGARRYHDMVEIDWQMNRHDLPASSLSTVMRAYFIEQEIRLGTRKMYIEGGTPHAMRFSFATARVSDLVVAKRSPLLLLLRSVALHAQDE